MDSCFCMFFMLVRFFVTFQGESGLYRLGKHMSGIAGWTAADRVDGEDCPWVFGRKHFVVSVVYQHFVYSLV